MRHLGADRGARGTLLAHCFQPPPPPLVAAAVSQLVIKTIPGYCRGLMRIVWHRNTHSHIKGATILIGAEIMVSGGDDTLRRRRTTAEE